MNCLEILEIEQI